MEFPCHVCSPHDDGQMIHPSCTICRCISAEHPAVSHPLGATYLAYRERSNGENRFRDKLGSHLSGVSRGSKPDTWPTPIPRPGRIRGGRHARLSLVSNQQRHGGHLSLAAGWLAGGGVTEARGSNIAFHFIILYTPRRHRSHRRRLDFDNMASDTPGAV